MPRPGKFPPRTFPEPPGAAVFYSAVVKASFIGRPNRFIARVMLEGREETVHVKNTGRCRELLVPGCTVYLEKSGNPSRKTLYDLIAVEKVLPDGQVLLVNMDSQAPNRVAAEWIQANRERFPSLSLVKPECKQGSSRFDFYIEYSGTRGKSGKMFLEVKGCTLEERGTALFPDAPTERGVKHLEELAHLRTAGGYECGVLIVIQMEGCRVFKPNRKTHPEFADALVAARNAGVEIYAIGCHVTPDSLTAGESVPVELC